MNNTKGLSEFIKNKQYRDALNLPEQIIENYELLAQGEYNRNYFFIHPITKEKLVLRINFGSQMHLPNQIEYEFNSLKLLENSSRTPVPIYVDGSKKHIQYGILVMKYIDGHHLNYLNELNLASSCLADIHSIKVHQNNHLVKPKNSFYAIIDECEEMFKVYYNSEFADKHIKNEINFLLSFSKKRFENVKSVDPYSIINTELNSTNFLVNNDKAYLVDWEKPIFGDPAQDLGHFLAPTTTFWKTDVILNPNQIEDFINLYIRELDNRIDSVGLKERVYDFIPANCLRGITWSAMAWIEYKNPNKEVLNESTAKKLEQYLNVEFLKLVKNLITN